MISTVELSGTTTTYIENECSGNVGIMSQLANIPYNYFHKISLYLCILMVPTQARSGDPRQGGAVSVEPIWHACIAICPIKHRMHTYSRCDYCDSTYACH